MQIFQMPWNRPPEATSGHCPNSPDGLIGPRSVKFGRVHRQIGAPHVRRGYRFSGPRYMPQCRRSSRSLDSFASIPQIFILLPPRYKTSPPATPHVLLPSTSYLQLRALCTVFRKVFQHRALLPGSCVVLPGSHGVTSVIVNQIIKLLPLPP